jgi:hypothetical protein
MDAKPEDEIKKIKKKMEMLKKSVIQDAGKLNALKKEGSMLQKDLKDLPD